MAGEPTGQPQHGETSEDGGLTSLSRGDYAEAVTRAGKDAIADNVPMAASALAYSTFLAIPSALLVLTGSFTLIASPDGIATVAEQLGRVAPGEAVTLFEDSLQRLDDRPSSSILMVVLGFLVALWSTTGAMTTLMNALNTAYDVEETRSFLRRRLLALALVGMTIVAFVAVFGLLVLGPQLTSLLAGRVGGWATWVWWLGQWPVLLGVLLVVFAAVFYWGPNVDQPRWTLVSPGALLAVLVWLASSALFAVYTSRFGSYNKAWGSFAAVIVMLTWLWLSGLALLLGAELNAEIDRRRARRPGTRAARKSETQRRAA